MKAVEVRRTSNTISESRLITRCCTSASCPQSLIPQAGDVCAYNGFGCGAPLKDLPARAKWDEKKAGER
jgi:hypothetical protein